MVIRAIKTKIFREGDDLFRFVAKYIKKVKENSVIVITSKIVSLSENMARKIENTSTREKLIKSESQWAMKTKYTWLTIKDGTVMSSAGVDESNADGKIILLPKDSYKSAATIRRKLMRHYKVKNLGVIISDSRLLPLRAGVVGISLGYAGFSGVRDYRGTPDIFGRILRLSRTDIADGLATAAVLEMGEGAEQQPLALITNSRVEFRNQIKRKELYIDPKEDIYQPLFEKIKKIKLKKS